MSRKTEIKVDSQVSNPTEVELAEEKRIYVILPEKVSVVFSHLKVVMPLGRSAAQAVHAARKMQEYENLDGAKPITTVLLSCRNDDEAFHVQRLLEQKGVRTYDFFDHDPAFYGRDTDVWTAFCTEPISIDQAVGAIDYLPLFGA